MKNRDKLGKFTGNKYKKINGVWFKGICEDCRIPIKGHLSKRCKPCHAKVPQLNYIPNKGKWNIGKKRTPEQIEKFKKNRKGKGLHPGVRYHNQVGKNHHNWKGGISPKNMLIRSSFEYKVWRKLVFERDNYTCQICFKRGGIQLNADHIKPFSLYPEHRLELDNGRTLCIDCHRETPTYGRKVTYV